MLVPKSLGCWPYTQFTFFNIDFCWLLIDFLHFWVLLTAINGGTTWPIDCVQPQTQFVQQWLARVDNTWLSYQYCQLSCYVTRFLFPWELFLWLSSHAKSIKIKKVCLEWYQASPSAHSFQHMPLFSQCYSIARSVYPFRWEAQKCAFLFGTLLDLFPHFVCIY